MSERVSPSKAEARLAMFCRRFNVKGPNEWSTYVDKAYKTNVGALACEFQSPGDGFTRSKIIRCVNESGGVDEINRAALRPAELYAAIGLAEELILHLIRVGVLTETAGA